MRRAIVIITTILTVLAIFGCGWVWSQISPVNKNQKEEKRLVIPLGTNEEKILEILKEKDLIKNKKIFNLILTLKGWHGKIQPGAYLVSENLNAFELAKKLTAGPYQKWVVVPPGKRKEQVALILKEALGWNESLTLGFIRVAEEGYLYPDTYLINTDAEPKLVFQKMKNNFNEKFTEEIQKELLAQNIRNDTAIKMASLIERESGSREDKPIIAGIIWNRLSKKMKLEIDATVQYALATQKLEELEEKGTFFGKDFDFWPSLGPGIVRKVNSPYNTYIKEGLPPGPICSPSLESILAVIYPAETTALYYLHSPDKQIHTAETYEEHQQNILKYLKN